ncbi:MAG: glycosyltransferase [Candidatus Pacebacteria bacterium]|nr:glycosyltransferase [Candidatus Paceibacterota bacterium]
MISIIIPTLNEETVIEKILKSLRESRDNYEIIVSDGCSRDKTAEISRKYANKVVVYGGTKRQTIGKGRNDGAAVASGEYLVFLDADVSIKEPDVFFEKALRVFERNKGLVAITAYIRVLPEFETLSDKIIWWCINSSYIFFNNIIRTGGASGEFQMIKAEAFKKVGGFNEILIGGEDHELFRRLARVGKTHFEKSLTIYHTGRRGHKLGWPKFVGVLVLASLPIFIKRYFLKEWKEIR